MESFSSMEEEIRELTDAMFDGQTDVARMQRLESLVLSDLRCLQMYVERINFLGVMFQRAKNRSPEESAMAVLQEFAEAVQLQERREQRGWYLFFGSLAASVLALVGWASIQSGAFRPAPLAMISSLSSDARTGSKTMELGRIVRQGEAITVEEGLLSLELPHVLVDVLGPASVRLDHAGSIYLNHGTLIAKVLNGGKGFTVKTPAAEIVDFGTEFLVLHEPEKGTDVSVRQGRVRATLLDKRGEPTQQLQLSDNRSAQFRVSSQSAREVEFHPQAFEPVDRSRGGIRSIDGMLRTSTTPPASLLNAEVFTHNHILVVPERQHVVLEQDLTVNGLEGPLRIPAGSVISSYLIHYDPPGDLSRAPRGAVTFFDQIAAVVVKTPDLTATDAALGLPATQFESGVFRGLELGLDEDKVQVSKDRHTVSFHFDMSPPANLDEARILVVSGPVAHEQ